MQLIGKAEIFPLNPNRIMPHYVIIRRKKRFLKENQDCNNNANDRTI